MTDIYGPIITRQDVEAAFLQTVKTWLTVYLYELERRGGRDVGSIARPKSWNVQAESRIWPEDQLPAILVVSGGLADQPTKDGDGLYRAGWSVGLMVVLSARTVSEAGELVGLYTAAVRTLIVQHPSLGGLATATEWRDESYNNAPVEVQRTGQAGLLEFSVYVDDIVSTRGGPATPPPDPTIEPGDWPLVQEADVLIQKESLT